MLPAVYREGKGAPGQKNSMATLYAFLIASYLFGHLAKYLTVSTPRF
jgi:hypothetical protein